MSNRTGKGGRYFRDDADSEPVLIERTNWTPDDGAEAPPVEDFYSVTDDEEDPDVLS